jgi:hypothetical protein
MTTKVNQHAETPPLAAPVYRHSSETQRSDNDAGGILRQQYPQTEPQK